MLRWFVHAARWLLAPLYLGLVLVLALVVVVFTREVWATLPLALALTPGGVIVAALSLIDLVLVANLLLIVILSGFDSYVAPVADDDPDTGLGRLGGVDFSGLKIKLVASIVAITAIELLKRFMAFDEGEVPTLSDPVLMWSAAIHAVFVVSALLMALTDRFAGSGKGTG